MPTTKRAREIDDEENRINNAITALSKRKKTNLSEHAREWKVDYYKVRRRLQGVPPALSKGGHYTTLDPTQEEAVGRTLERLDDLGFSATPSMLQDIANDVLKEGHNDPSISPRTVSDDWPRRFLKRYPHYFVRSSKVLAKDRGTVTTRGLNNSSNL